MYSMIPYQMSRNYLGSVALIILEPLIRQSNIIFIFIVSTALVCNESTLWLGAYETVVIGCG
jgi:hypothetical protein